MHSGQSSSGASSVSGSDIAPPMQHSYCAQCWIVNMWPVSWPAILSVRSRHLRNAASPDAGSP